ncbi:MAG: hypothetical protein ABSF93_18365 [Candidatus Sulfotelmatobacter sp.]|jgi:hypothetical protein
MSLVKFNIACELRKALKGKETKVPADVLLQYAAPVYLEAVKTAKVQAKERTGIDELERMFRLEDTRG